MESAGKYLDHSPWFVRRKIYAGELAGVKFANGKLMVEKRELDRFIAEHRV